MAFGEELLKALSATQYKAADSPYAIGSQAVSAISPNLVNPYGSTGSNIAITAGSGMLAALLAGLAENDAKSQNAAFAPSITQFKNADPTQQAQLAAKEPRLSSLYNAMLANSLTNDMEIKQEVAKFKTMNPLETNAEIAKRQQLGPIELEQKLAQENALSPIRIGEEVNKYEALQPLKREDAFIEQAGTMLAPEGNIITPENEILKIADPQKRELDLSAAKIRQELFKQKGIAETPTGQEQIIDVKKQKAEEDLKDLQSRFNATEAAKQYVQVRPAAEAMVGALKDKGIVSDQELSRYGILLVEPGMAVKEGEQAAILNSQSIPEAWKGQMSRAAKGQSGLEDNVREGLKRLAIRAYDGRLKNFQDALKFFKNEAKIKQLDDSRVSYIGDGLTVEQVFGANETKNIGGQVFEKVEGGWRLKQ